MELAEQRAVERAQQAALQQALQAHLQALQAHQQALQAHQQVLQAEQQAQQQVQQEALEAEQQAKHQAQQQALQAWQQVLQVQEKGHEKVLKVMREAASAITEQMRVSWIAEERAAVLLRSWGKMDLRGVLEHIEAGRTMHPYASRKDMWAKLLRESNNAALLASLKKACRKDGAGVDDAAKLVSDLYAALPPRPTHGHQSYHLREGSWVLISGLEPRFMEAGVCICRHFCYPYQAPCEDDGTGP